MKHSFLSYSTLLILSTSSVYAHKSPTLHIHDSDNNTVEVNESSTPLQQQWAAHHAADNTDFSTTDKPESHHEDVTHYYDKDDNKVLLHSESTPNERKWATKQSINTTDYIQK